jgi:hypothetical protein
MTARDSRYNASPKGKERNKRRESKPYRLGYQAGYKAGQKAKKAPHIDPEWLKTARLNGSVEDWIMRALNVREASIDSDGSVWVEDPSRGRWLSQDEINALCARIDQGV